MEVLLPALGGALLLATWIAWAVQRPREQRGDPVDAWSAVLRALQLVEKPKGPIGGRSAAGRVEGVDVTVTRLPSTEDSRSSSIGTVSVSLPGFPEKVALFDFYEGMGAVQTGPAHELSEVGAQGFFAFGAAEFVLPLLSAPVRRLLVRLGQCARIRADKSGLHVSLYERSADAEKCQRLVTDTALLAKALTQAAADREGSTAAIVLEDPHPEMRLRCLRLLVSRADRGETHRSVLERAMADADPQVRLAAGRALGESGFEGLRSAALDARLEPKARVEALSHLLARFPRERTVSVLGELLSSPETSQARSMALEHARQHRWEELRQPMMELALHAGPATAARAAAALEAIGAPSDVWHSLLERPIDDVRLPAARQLGKLGGVESISALHRAAEEAMPVSELRREARAAISLIQERLGLSTAGGLSITDAAAPSGALSRPRSSEGGLSPGEGQ
ncbi:MAG: hypothetical protein JNJ88_05340 [Planctomycetes bacterium]|nr:hypothetical protein [Planctomycetota bacterium]